MRAPIVLPALFTILACARAVPAPGDATPPGGAAPGAANREGAAAVDRLAEAMREQIAREAPGEVAVALVDLETGRRIGIGDDVSMHAASTMKVPVLVELFRQAAEGRYSLDDSVVVRNEFTSIADGSRYSLSPEDDSETGLYGMIGSKTTVRELARRMIVRSSNLATNILIERVSAESVRRTMAKLGAEDMRVLRGVEDTPAFRRGMNNTTTAGAFARVLEAIARCETGVAAGTPAASLGLSRTQCRELSDILAGQEFTEMIPAGVPAGVRVANKTGWITGIQHDGAIIYPPGRAPYVLVVLTRGIEDRAAAAKVASDLSRMAWEALVGAPARVAGLPSTDELLDLHRRHRVGAITEREFTHETYWSTVGPVIDGASTLSREEVGRSVEGRPLYLVRYGTGPTRVLLWSQMHGDESTATMALADLFRFLAESPDHPLARRIAERLTVLFVPMLNPDGAERFQRRNAYGIDINRDARALVTPEARTLKAIRDRYHPEFGFNLHDQNVRTRVATSDRTAAIALLAPPFDEARSDNAVRTRAKQVAAVIRQAVEPLVAGHIAKYDDSFNPRAFGDLMQQWGTSTVLIESGGWKDDPEKQYLRAANFVAILTALDAIATGAYASADPSAYEGLPYNGRPVNDLLIRGATIALPGLAPYRADIAVDFAEPLERTGGRIVDVGDLAEAAARDTLDLTGLFLHPTGPADRLVGAPASFTIRRGADPASEEVGMIDAGIVRRRTAAAPDR